MLYRGHTHARSNSQSQFAAAALCGRSSKQFAHFPVHFSDQKWSFFAGNNGYIDKMIKVRMI